MTSSNEWVSTSTPYLTPPESGGDAWTQEATVRQGKGTQKLVHAGEVTAPPQVAEAFGLSEGTHVITRRRIMYLDEDPVELADTYYPLWIAGGTRLVEPQKIRGGAINLLVELGYVAARVQEDVSARMPTGAERAELRLPADEPVLVLHRITFDKDSQPIQADAMVTPARLRRLRYELKVS